MLSEKILKNIPGLDLSLTYLTFHKGYSKGHKGKFLSDVIKFKSRNKSPFGVSHSEVLLSNDLGEYSNMSFSSRGSDKVRGVSFKPIEYSHPDRWYFVPFTSHDLSYRVAKHSKLIIPPVRPEEALLDHCFRHEGQRYAYGDLLSVFVLRLPFQNKSKRFCSEMTSHLFEFKNELVYPNEHMSAALETNGGRYFEFTPDGEVVENNLSWYSGERML